MNLLQKFLHRKSNLEFAVPPQNLIDFVGGGTPEYHKQVGNEFLNYFITFANLKPSEAVLDIGCGCGRIAIPLAKYLTTGSYRGFDVSKEAIEWCIKNVNKKKQNFKFDFIDIYNGGSNPNGKLKASELIFPYSEKCFDFIFLTSVFTHMMPKDMEHYVSEIERVLKDDGRVLVTHFLINKESLGCIEKDLSIFKGISNMGEYYSIKNQIHEGFIAFDEEYIKEMYLKNNLNILSLHYGMWCGRQNYLSGQDILVLKKRS